MPFSSPSNSQDSNPIPNDSFGVSTVNKPGKVPSILIVEDEGIIAMVIEAQVRRMGFDVCDVVDTGKRALEVALAKRPDVILLDLQLKGTLDGVEVALQLREQMSLAIIFISAHSDLHTIERVKNAEPDGFLLKPFNERLLSITLTTVLHHHRMETSRKELQAAKQAFNERFTKLLDYMPDAVVTINEAHRITNANMGCKRIFGYEEGELVGQFIDILIPDRYRASHSHMVHKFLGDNSTIKGMRKQRPISALRKNGKEFAAEASVFWIKEDEVGGKTGAVVLRDITERRKLEQQLLESQKLDAVGRLAATVAHDFNGWLTVIQLNAEILSETIQAEGDEHECLDGILSALESGTALIQQLLSLSRQQPTMPQPVEVALTLHGMGGILRTLVGPRIKLTMELDVNTGWIFADPRQLAQVVLNLAGNSRDAMPAGGKIKISSEIKVDKTGAMFGGMKYAAIKISDNGIGMSPETLERAFESFFTTKSARKGTGLGLSSVRMLMSRMGGSIDLASEMGKGTTATLCFPKLPGGASSHAITAIAPSVKKTVRHSLLLVDDDPAILRPLSWLLRRAGYEVDTANGPGAALALCEQRSPPYDLLISDIVMPIINGVELAKLIQRWSPQIGVLLVSGYARPKEVKDADEAGYPLIRKPFAPEKMLETIRTMIG